MSKTVRIVGGYAFGWILWISFLLPQVQEIFQVQGKRWVYILLFSLLMSYLLVPVARKIAFRYSILDQPAQRKDHKSATPLLGGVAIYIAFIAALLANNILDNSVTTILLAGTAVMAISLADDITALSAKFKLVIQLAAGGVVFWSGIQISIFPTHGVSEIASMFSWAGNLFVTLLWIIGITNAMNFLDGMDGLAAGSGVVISLFLGIVAFQTRQPFLGWLSMAMAGSCLGFLPYNFRRNESATIFLGDAGSIFIGFMLACLAIKGNWAENNPIVSTCTPVLIFGVLIFDMIHTTVTRIATGKVRSFHDWVEYVGKDHIHHRFYRIFYDKWKTVLMILTVSTCLGISAVVLRLADTFNTFLIVFQGILAFSMMSAINFYQEKALLQVKERRETFRLQVLFEVAVNFLEEKNTIDGVVLDVSYSGANVLMKSSNPVRVGAHIRIEDREFADLGLFWPDAKIVRQKEAVLSSNGDNIEGYMQCGVQFVDCDEKNIVELIEAIQKKQIEKKFHKI